MIALGSILAVVIVAAFYVRAAGRLYMIEAEALLERPASEQHETEEVAA